jgi:glucose-6-phosphate 1-epimerase
MQQKILQELNRQFGGDGVGFAEGRGGLPVARLKNRGGGGAEVYLHGAHVTAFNKAGGPGVLFVSGQSLFRPDRAIRGGIPVIFPWFGQRQPDPVGKSPMHGFARLSAWEVESARGGAEAVSLTLSLTPNDLSRSLWPHDFRLTYTVTLDGDALKLDLTVTNTGAEGFAFEEALHTYFAVGDVRRVSVEGLAHANYLDKTENFAEKTQDAAPVTFSGETDRVYLGTPATVTIRDPGLGRRVVVEKGHSEATVVWNPWVEKAKAMADFGDEEWPQMVCVETANVGPHAVTLAAGASHTMRVGISTVAAEGGVSR